MKETFATGYHTVTFQKLFSIANPDETTAECLCHGQNSLRLLLSCISDNGCKGEASSLSCQQALRNTDLLQPSHHPVGLPALMPFTCSSSPHFLVKKGTPDFSGLELFLRCDTDASTQQPVLLAADGIEPSVLPFASNSIKKL